MRKINTARLLTWTVVTLLLAVLALYFRTYRLHGGIFLMLKTPESAATELVTKALRRQVETGMATQLENLSREEKKLILDAQVRNIKQRDSGKFQTAVQNIQKEITHAREGARAFKYLLEADPYHYEHQIKNIISEGHISDTVKDGKYLMPLMRYPHGHWVAFNLHPYAGYFFYRLLHGVSQRIDLVTAIAWYPIVLCLLILPVFWFLSRSLGLGIFEYVLGSLTVLLSPIVIQRSALGWFDTDPYNYLFPFLILAFVLYGMREGERTMRYWMAAGFFTGMYALFWTGWAFIFVLIPFAAGGSALFCFWQDEFKNSASFRRSLRNIGGYTGAVILSASIFMTPKGFLNSILLGWSVLGKFALHTEDIWPNIFLTVGESRAIGFKKLIFLTGNYVTFLFAAIGFLGEAFQSRKERDAVRLKRFFFLLLVTLPILFMSLKTERFSILFVIPLSIYAAWGGGYLARFVSRLTPASVPGQAGFLRSGARVFVLILFLPLLLLSAHVVSRSIKPIMNDAWADSLAYIKENTPANAVVNSWWPPGYFITAMAERAVTADGGTQHFREVFWLAKAWMTDNERQAGGILRMLNLSGNKACEYLTEEAGLDTADAVDLLLKVTALNREAASLELPASLNEEQKKDLLDMTHGDLPAMPPTYFLVYGDLVKQNLAVSVVANWDFRKAKAVEAQKRSKKSRLIQNYFKNSSKSYIDETIQIVGEFLKYTDAAKVSGQIEDHLLFENGLVVDVKNKTAQLYQPQKGLQGRVRFLFYLENGELVRKDQPGPWVNASALLFDSGGQYQTVLADEKLIQSMLYRLYYLEGAGLQLFRPVVRHSDAESGETVKVYELDRKKLYDSK